MPTSAAPARATSVRGSSGRQRVEEHAAVACASRSRPSRIATMPRSSRRRISRPKPCLSAIAAAGQLDRRERIVAGLGARPACARRPADRCAARTAACRSRRATAHRRGRRRPPRTSRSRAAPRSASCGTDRSASRAAPRPGPGAGTAGWRAASSASRSARWLVNSRNARPVVIASSSRHALGGRRRRTRRSTGRQIARHVEHRLAARSRTAS